MHRRIVIAALAAATLAAACSDDAATSPTTVAPATTAIPAPTTAAPAPTSVPSTPPSSAAGAPTTAPATTPATPAPSTPATVPATSVPDGAPSDGLVSGEGWSVSGALTELPAVDSDTFEITAADVARAAEVLGVERPDPSDREAIIDGWILPLTFPGTPDYRPVPLWVPIPSPILPNTFAVGTDARDLLGWSVADVDAFVHLQPEPPGYLSVVTGELPDDALGGLAEVSDGVLTTGDGDDFETNLTGDRTVDELGRPVRLARRDALIAMGLSTPLVETWLEASDERATMADDPRLAAVAAELDAHGVVSAQLFRNTFSGLPNMVGLSPEEAARQLAELPVTVPFDTVGIGWRLTDGSAPEVIVVYTPLADFETFAGQIEAAITEGVSFANGAPVAENLGVTELDITVGDGVVTVTYEPVERFWYSAVQAVYQRDLPFVSS